MGLLLVLLWCSASRWEVIADNSRSSQFGGFNSRFGRQKFPVRHATGIGLQAYDLACSSHDRRPAVSGKSMNFPFEREKPRIDRPHRGVRAAMLSGTAR